MAEFEESGERPAEFCERRELALGSLRQWLYRLRRERREAAQKVSQRFLPLVATKAPDSGGAGACLLRVSGAELSFGELPAPSYLAELLRLMDR